MTIPPSLQPLITRLQSDYPEARLYFVGGVVRDYFLKRPTKDIDAVITHVPADELSELLAQLGEVNLVGKRFGVFKFKPSGSNKVIDLALPRKESSRSFSGAYRDFDIQSDPMLPIEVDLSRRDFTINAMAYDVMANELIDPFFGQKDLERKVIRSVGSAVTRFQEDYSRMLRAIRFACQLDFDFAEGVQQALPQMMKHLNDKILDDYVVAREVISSELLKALDANPVGFLERADTYSVLEVLLPEVLALKACEQSPPYHFEGTAWNHLLLTFKELESASYRAIFPEPPSLMLKLGILFHDLGKPETASRDEKEFGRIHFLGHEKVGAELTRAICTRLRLSASPNHAIDCDGLVWLVREHLFSILRKDQDVPKTLLEDLFFNRTKPSKELLPLMYVDQKASLRQDGRGSIEEFERIHTLVHDLAPDGVLPEPLVTGDDMMKWKQLKPGPEIGSLLKKVREAQLQGSISTKDEAKAFVSTL